MPWVGNASRNCQRSPESVGTLRSVPPNRQLYRRSVEIHRTVGTNTYTALERLKHIQCVYSNIYMPGSGSSNRSEMILTCRPFVRTVETDTLYHSPGRLKHIQCVYSNIYMPGSGSSNRSEMILTCRPFVRTVETDTLYHSPGRLKHIQCVQPRRSNMICPSRA